MPVGYRSHLVAQFVGLSSAGYFFHSFVFLGIWASCATPFTLRFIVAEKVLRQLFSFWPITFPLGGCFLLLALLTWIVSRWPFQPGITSSLGQQDRTRMIGRLRRSYSDLLAQTLQGIAWMDITLSEIPDAVRNAATLLLRSVNQPEHLLPVGTSILDAYDQAEQELLILGAPGFGKSTLLLELAQQLGSVV